LSFFKLGDFSPLECGALDALELCALERAGSEPLSLTEFDLVERDRLVALTGSTVVSLVERDRFVAITGSTVVGLVSANFRFRATGISLQKPKHPDVNHALLI